MEEEKEQTQANQDWNPDYFPTSATPVFRSTALLVLLVIALCVAAYYFSNQDDGSVNGQPQIIGQKGKNNAVVDESNDDGEDIVGDEQDVEEE